MILSRLRKSFTVSEISPPIALAHLTALKQQMPLLYLLLTTNSVALALTHLFIAPAAVLVLPFLVLLTVAGLRARFWMRLDTASLAPGDYLRVLKKTNRLTALLGPFIVVWALSIEHFDNDAADLHILFFLALTSIGCILCLMHLRSAALIIVSTVLVPTIVVALYERGPELAMVALNLAFIGFVILRVLAIQHRDFVSLAKQNAALGELGEQNLRLAATDMLTGLPNRRSFFPALEDALSEASSAAGAVMLAIIDLDGFKHINDSFGHVAGDRVLVAIAERLRSALPSSALLARIGGDEFAIIARGAADPGASEAVGVALRSAVAQPVRCAESHMCLGASVGIAHWKHGQTTADLIERADYAMYKSKSAGCGEHVVFSDEHESEIQNKGVLEGCLRHADLSAELSLMFQPIYDVDLEKTVAFEALARWHSPHLGQVPPDRFVTIAESIGLINVVTRTLLAKLLRTMESWENDAVVSFNLSSHDIVSPAAVDEIAGLIRASSIDPSRIHFEITETAMLTDFARAQAGLSVLKSLGGAFSLDDFGVGYSSLSHVHRLPVDKLKVDKSFTREVTTHSTARSIVASIAGLAHGLRFECIVEGVETLEQMVLLRGLGCRLMQGYFFSRPMPAEAVPPFLAAEKAALGASLQEDDDRQARLVAA